MILNHVGFASIVSHCLKTSECKSLLVDDLLFGGMKVRVCYGNTIYEKNFLQDEPTIKGVRNGFNLSSFCLIIVSLCLKAVKSKAFLVYELQCEQTRFESAKVTHLKMLVLQWDKSDIVS